MKKRYLFIAGTALSSLVLAQTPKFDMFGQQIQPVSKDSFTIRPAIPTETTFYCGTPVYKDLCAAFTSLVALNDPKVDEILKKLPDFQLRDSTGAVIFPRP